MHSHGTRQGSDKHCKVVLILVLMEDALARLSVIPVSENEFEVLILVLMEDALAPYEKVRDKWRY